VSFVSFSVVDGKSGCFSLVWGRKLVEGLHKL